jgi:HK97 gp10 family phage protein
VADFIGISGGEEIARALEGFAANVERNILRGGLRAGAQVILEEAKARVPQDTGALRDSLSVRTGAKGGKVFALVRAGRSKKKDDPWYAHLVEYGVKRHVIIAGGGTKKGKALAAGARILGEKVDHPGAPAKPFMRPALDAKAGEAIDATAEYLRNRIARGK